jgi:hypothetical protein
LTTAVYRHAWVRLATLIIALILMLVLGVQSCAVAAGGSIAGSLSTASDDKAKADELSSGGAVGVLVALLWLIAAALVIGKPRVSMWLFGIAGVIALLGGTTGFSDLYVWGIVSFVFALMSWRGTKEKARDAAKVTQQYEADVAAAAARMQQPPSEAP